MRNRKMATSPIILLRFLLVVTAIVFVMFYILYGSIGFVAYLQHESVGSTVRDCILRQPDHMQIDNMSSIVNKCIVNHSGIRDSQLIVLDSEYGGNKYFLHMQSINPTDSCTFVTIGIASSTTVERRFLQSYPHCQLFGIEAAPNNYGDYAKIGKIIPFAIGVTAGNITMRLFNDQSYYDKIVPVRALNDVLIEYVGTTIIDFATLNIDGAEFPILEALQFDGRLTNAGVIFCQLDVEFHPNLYKALVDRQFSFIVFWKRFLANSAYLPIKVKYYNFVGRKVSFVNVRNTYCNDRFNFNEYF